MLIPASWLPSGALKIYLYVNTLLSCRNAARGGTGVPTPWDPAHRPGVTEFRTGSSADIAPRYVTGSSGAASAAGRSDKAAAMPIPRSGVSSATAASSSTAGGSRGASAAPSPAVQGRAPAMKAGTVPPNSTAASLASNTSGAASGAGGAAASTGAAGSGADDAAGLNDAQRGADGELPSDSFEEQLIDNLLFHFGT